MTKPGPHAAKLIGDSRAPCESTSLMAPTMLAGLLGSTVALSIAAVGVSEGIFGAVAVRGGQARMRTHAKAA